MDGSLFEVGKRFLLGTNAVVTIDRHLVTGSGKQIYVATSEEGPVLLTWIDEGAIGPDEVETLESMLRSGPPAAGFVWPEPVTASAILPGFGYIERPVKPPFESAAGLRWSSDLRTSTSVAFHLAEAFAALHRNFYALTAFDLEMVAYEPIAGDFRLDRCCDRVATFARSRHLSGDLRFVAPEAQRADAVASTENDLWALAVAISYLLLRNHPLEGARKLGGQAVYGLDALFIFDPEDVSNAPVPEFQGQLIERWARLPGFLKEKLLQTFTRGIPDPSQRVTGAEWMAALAQLRDSIFIDDEGQEAFFDPSQGPGPARLLFGDRYVMLNHDTRLYAHHLLPANRYDFSVPMAEVSQHPTDPSIRGLRNLTEEPWKITTPQGRTKEVPPGKSLAIAPGTYVQFGSVSAEIVA